ncbi:hypothetical protein Dsin_000095 [Dipteronia sinensis]|uniref:DUF4283 domain-containing protein n=1 Tax=Dipteronia sinensis TaxID=43782 RepID=A0AAD9Z007_9ROSI|nr:hypothetical protein Dsin_000095 [Dipteronia sinensis]
MKSLVQENERISRLNRSLYKKLKEIQELSLKENKELKDKILSLKNNLKDSNERLGVLKSEIELRDNSLDCAKRLENVLRVKISEHENQERVLNDKLNEVNKVISKMSSSSNKVETLNKIAKHPNDKRGLGYVNEKITHSTNKPIFVKASSKLNIGTLSNGKAMDAIGGASTSTSTSTIKVKDKTQHGQIQCSSSSNAKSKASRTIHQKGKFVRRQNALNAQANGKLLKFITICHYCNMVRHIRPRCFEYIHKCKQANYLLDMSWLNGPRQSSMYGFRTRPRKTLEKHVEKNIVDDLLVKSCVVPHSTMHKKIDNALFDLFENVTDRINVPNNKSKHVNRIWIACVGVPIRFWNEAFFNKAGQKLGEMVMIEEETILKKRLDRGKILVLLPINHSCPDLIKVKVGPIKHKVRSSLSLNEEKYAVSSPTSRESKKERNSCLAAKGQAMKPRSLTSNFKISWNLKEEIYKAIKIGVALGLISMARKWGWLMFLQKQRGS